MPDQVNPFETPSSDKLGDDTGIALTDKLLPVDTRLEPAPIDYAAVEAKIKAQLLIAAEAELNAAVGKMIRHYGLNETNKQAMVRRVMSGLKKI